MKNLQKSYKKYNFKVTFSEVCLSRNLNLPSKCEKNPIKHMQNTKLSYIPEKELCFPEDNHLLLPKCEKVSQIIKYKNLCTNNIHKK